MVIFIWINLINFFEVGVLFFCYLLFRFILKEKRVRYEISWEFGGVWWEFRKEKWSFLKISVGGIIDFFFSFFLLVYLNGYEKVFFKLMFFRDNKIYLWGYYKKKVFDFCNIGSENME